VSSSFEEYQALKQQLKNIDYKGYPLDRVLGSYLAELSWKYKFKKIRRYASAEIMALRCFYGGEKNSN
jgi:hypothetical protein